MDEKLIVRIICDREVGTAFYVAPDTLLTAWHTVSSDKNTESCVVKDPNEGDLLFKVVNILEEADVAILKVEGRKSKDYLPLLSHRIKVGEEFGLFGYPDIENQEGLRIKGHISQRLHDTTADFRLLTNDVDASYNYAGMSGAPVFQGDQVVGVVIEQEGNGLNVISVQKIEKLGLEKIVHIEQEDNLTEVPDSIAKEVESAHPNYSVIQLLDERLSVIGSKWLLLYGSPGCGKTTLSAGYDPEDKNIEALSRFFFKVPNDQVSRSVRCSESYFVDWIESVYVTQTGRDIEKLTFEDKVKSITEWLTQVSNVIAERGKRGILIIDGLDELVSEKENRVDAFLSLFPTALPQNISVVLSCITKEILPASIIEKIGMDDYIKVTPLNMASCESYIQENSGDWDKPYSFVQAVAFKTEGHPLYMNYLCRYITETFNATTDEQQLTEWVSSLPSIGGDIRSYYEAVWKKAAPHGVAYEVLALLSQIRGPIKELQLIGMMRNPNPYEFKSSTKEFQHLMKEKDTDIYEIYHSSFRLFVTEKLSTIISLTNDQIASYCEKYPDTTYSIENYLHHVVNGSNIQKGLSMCNQAWADSCALNDVSPDLIMQDIKECLSFAVDSNLPVEVVRLMLLAQRIETRCDSIMVDNATDVANLKIAMGKPEVALKYLVRDNILLVGIDSAMIYLRVLFELGYENEAVVLSSAIDAAIRKQINDNLGKESSIDIFLQKGFLIVEGIMAGYEDISDLQSYFRFIDQLLPDNDEQAIHEKNEILDFIAAYKLSNQLRVGRKINISKYLEISGNGWNKSMMMLFLKALALYDEKDTELTIKGHNKAYDDCLRQVEEALKNHEFTFEGDDLAGLLSTLIDKNIQADIVQKYLKKYNPKPGSFKFRDDNGVDFDDVSVNNYYRESLYQAYADENMPCPPLNRNYYGDHGWEQYVETLVIRSAYINGTAYRKRAAGDNYKELYPLVKEILEHIDFTFMERIKWQRSYLLPEKLFTFIYCKLADIFCEFFENKLNEFMEHLQGRMSDQLCLYREGYCSVLINLIRVFVNKRKGLTMAHQLADKAVEYVMYAVQNRAERCSCLLQICLYYALLNEKEKVKNVYQEVLNSSMGPEWYKEAQLELINRFKNFGIGFKDYQIDHMAAIFEEASGEMTFQRYVQQQKDEFVATIATVSSLSDAISYYKFETLPSAEIIVKNAEDWKVDMPEKGAGYDLGANHLIESSAVCQLLTACKDASPYIKYAISELFWENLDKMHNDYRYAQLHSDIINAIGEEKAISDIVPRMAEYYAHEYNHDGKGDYLRDLEKTTVPKTVLDELEKQLKSLGYTWKRVVKQHNIMKETESHTESLFDLPSSKAILERCRKDIVSPIGSYWYSLNDFITPLVKKSDFDVSVLLDVIAEHYDTNVRPSKEQFEKFRWFKGKQDEQDKDEQLIHLLIWYLVHPDKVVANRAYTSVKWLLSYDERVIDCLIAEILNPSEVGLETVSSSILLEVAQENPKVVLEHIKKNNAESQILDVHNFSVSRNLYEIAKVISDKLGDDDLLIKMLAIFPKTLPNRGDVLFDNEDMMFLEHKIDKLNYLQVTGGEFAKRYLEEEKRMKEKGIVHTLIQSDIYIRRSFYLDYLPKGRYDRAMEDLLNKLLYSKVDQMRAGQVYYAINA